MPLTHDSHPPVQASISLTAEPTVAGILRYLPLASPWEGMEGRSQINVVLSISNNLPGDVTVSTIQLSAAGTVKTFHVDLTIASGHTKSWTQTEDYVPSGTELTSLHIKLEGNGFARAPEFTLAMAPAVSPTPSCCYRFWARADDLRHDEFWHVNGTSHAQGNSAQLFAYDVNVAAPDPNGWQGLNNLLPGTDGSMNEHHRIWGKPIYAVADGVVIDFRNDYPTNAVPGQIDLLAQDYWQGGSVVDGNGNFFSIAGNGETVLYAHMQPGSLNRALLRTNAPVKAGDYLGLAGNSGASSAPHMHIHAVATGSGTYPWTGDARPMLFEGLRTIMYTAISTPGHPGWAAIERRGFAIGDCAVWPLPSVPVPRAPSLITHFALSEQGQLWVTLARKIRTTAARMPCRGAYLDFDPGGEADIVVVHDTHPHVIGTDRRVWEGRTNGWFPVPGSPLCRRLAVDPANDGQLWALSTERRIFRYAGIGSWIEPVGHGLGKEICLANGQVHVIGDDDRIWKHVGAGGWQPLPGDQKAVRLAADSATGKLWIITSDGEVLSSHGSGDWDKAADVPGTDSAKHAISLALAVLDGRPYVIGPDLNLWAASAGFGWYRVLLTEPA